MTPDEMSALLEDLAPTDAPQQMAFAAEVLREATALPTRAVALAGVSDAAVAGKARALVGALEEMAVGALLGATPSASMAEEVWRVRTAAAAAIALRARVAKHLISSLGDRRLVPIPAGLEGLARAPQSRLCDEAYVALRELVDTAESRGGFTLDRRAFLRLANDEKDTEIASAMAGLPFTRLVEDAEV